MKRAAVAGDAPAFTIVELLVSTALMVLLIALLLSAISQTSRIWTRAQAQVTTFQQARAAFDSVTRNLSQATLNPYWRAFDRGTPGRVDYAYVRESDLHFISGRAAGSGLLAGNAEQRPTHAVFFQAPLGATSVTSPALQGRPKYAPLSHLLTACGYWVEWTDGMERLPPFLREKFPRWPEGWRFRLHELQQRTELLGIFDPAKQTGPTQWLQDALGDRKSTGGYAQARIIAENVVALVLLPKLAERDRRAPTRVDDLTADYEYDSRAPLAGTGAGGPETPRVHQLPPLVEVVLVAIDETSAARQADRTGSTPPPWTKGLFQKIGQPEDLEADLRTLEERLIADRMNARFFRAEVVLRASKWSRDAEL